MGAMGSDEPINLREWRPRTAKQKGRLFTCGRPGRATFGRDRICVDNDTINRWLNGLPKADVLHIVSLLGQKRDGFSEFGYYPFRSSSESGAKPTFQEWLHERYCRRFAVHEFPTTDCQGIPPGTLAMVTRRVLELIENGNTVVVVDSAGDQRTARICEVIAYRE